MSKEQMKQVIIGSNGEILVGGEGTESGLRTGNKE